jgi:SAM-dependent MidA family methyltransferase
MSAGNSALTKIIRDEIRRTGPISFARFMQLALYHPQHGYYSSGRATIGRRGDYFTNVSVGPLFGTLLAAQFIEIWERLGKVDNFTIVEQGAHDGQFGHDVLTAIRTRAAQLFETLRYQIVEPFPILQDRQSQTLREFEGKVSWRNTIAGVDPFVGVHFSNELLDAMPVNLRERSVGLTGDEFVFVECAGDDESKPNESHLDWIDGVSATLQRGVVIAIDYGFSRNEFHEVVQARAQHRHLDSPLEQIGEADISIHVNWTDIAERAEANGLQVAGFTDQHHFITGIISTWPGLLASGLSNSTDEIGRVSIGPESKMKRALQTLLHPEMLGRAFQVLALEKQPLLGAAPGVAKLLSGFKFARCGRTSIGL